MPIFHYIAFNAKGDKVDGSIDATNLQIARNKLKQQKLYVKELKEDSAKRDRELFPFLSRILYRISRKEIGLFARQLGTLLGAGISIDEALSDVWEQTSNPHLKKIISQIKEDVIHGKSLSEGLGIQKQIFPPVYESMIRVGEATGSYEPTLYRLAELEEKNEELKGKAITALIYPAFMLVMSMAVVLFLLTTVIPQIESMFASLKGELPLPTRVVIALSHFIRDFWPFAILTFLAGMFGFYRYTKTAEGKKKWHGFILKIPFFGTLLKKIQVGRFARNLGVLLEAKVPLLSALEIVAGTVGNEVFAAELIKAGLDIQEGASFKESLKNSAILPHMAKGMIGAGEASDRMGEMLIKVAQILESEVETNVRGLTTSLEPIMIVVMGFLVGGIMAAVMMPLYKMTEYIK